MAKTYTIASARAELADIVDEVEAGSDVELTRRGKKVAIVMSPARYARLRGKRVAFMTAYETSVRDTIYPRSALTVLGELLKQRRGERRESGDCLTPAHEIPPR